MAGLAAAGGHGCLARLVASAPSGHASTFGSACFEIAFTAPDSREWHINPDGTPVETPSALAPNTSPTITGLPNGTFDESFVASDGTLWVANSATGGQQFKPCGAPYLIQSGTSPSITSTPDGTNWHLIATQLTDSKLVFQAGSDLLSQGICTSDVSTSSEGSTPDIVALANGGYAETWVAPTGWSGSTPGTVPGWLGTDLASRLARAR